MKNKGRISGEYKVTLKYTGLTMDELCKLLKLVDSGKLGCCGGYEDSRDLNVRRDYYQDCDGFEEPSGTYNATIVVDQAEGIAKESWRNWTNEVLCACTHAEKLRQIIKDETGIE